ncbi:MAG TPA: type II toxin-antitoxin system antitoxin SocA domain-containing protein [Puia sp.]|nr:type II toxin-antitoxin system antitoxin SocA domain-containing protein [Puia sp.]
MEKNKPQGNIKLKRQIKSFEFRKESFDIFYHNWVDQDDDEEFTTTELDELNLAQVHNQYRNKYCIPFVDEIRSTREQYGLSASKMSEILGLGPNVYRNYENGEIPSITTGRLIQLAKDPEEFRKLIALNQNELELHEMERINKKVESKLTSWNFIDNKLDERLFGTKEPNIYNGYRVPDIDRIGTIVKYFAQKTEPFKTKMNKLLFYADFLHYSRTGYSISGLTYIAIARGPVPKNYGGIYDRLSEFGFVNIEEVEFDDFGGEKFLNPDGEANMEIFTEIERESIQDVCESLGNLKTSQIVNASHDEDAWKKNIDEHNRISYDYGFILRHIE